MVGPTDQFSAAGNAAIEELLLESIRAGDFPSAVYLVTESGKARFGGALGLAVKVPVEIPATMKTIYDVASLTKVLVTGLLAARSLESGAISLNTRIGDLIPELRDTDKSQITILQLATHTSGLQAWLPLYMIADAPEKVIEAIGGTEVADEPGSVIYSDLNFLLLQAVIERIAGMSLDKAAFAEIFEPLGSTSTYFDPDEALRDQIAASEHGNRFELQTCIDSGFGPQFGDEGDIAGTLRENLIWGKVHDGNALFLGGVAGHAGLFSSAADISAIAAQFLAGRSMLLNDETCELFKTNFTPGMNEDRSFAFQLASTPDSTAGAMMSRNSFGHNGFTGTSLWIDPDKDRSFILLTNRTHCRDLPFKNINSVRRRFHDLAVSELDRNR